MPVTCTVTPAITFASNTNVTSAELNQAAQPQVSVPDGAITGAALNVASVVAALGEGAAGSNYFLNPNFARVRWTRGSSAVACPVDTQTFRADDWWCRPAGAAVTYERANAGPDVLSLDSAQLTGASSVTTVDFGQDIASHIASALAAPIVVSLYVYNNTGGTLTPTLRIDTPASADDFTSVTNRYSTASSTPGATAQWTRHTWVLDATAFANMANGARVYLRFPDGSLTAGKSLRIAQAKIERGTARTAFTVPLEEAAEEDEALPATTEDATNVLSNPDFLAPTWSTTAAITLTSATDIWGVQNWWVNAAGSGSTARLQRDTTTPNTRSLHSAKVTGGAGTNEVKIGQDVPSHLAAGCRREMVFAVEFYNGTGASIAPTLKIQTCNSEDVFSSTASVRSQTLATCPDAQWTRLTDAFDATAFSNMANGFRIWLEVPSGALDGGVKLVRVAQASLTPGISAPTFQPASPSSLSAAVTGTARHLRCAYATDSTLTVAADEIILRDEAGEPLRVTGLSGTVNIATASAVNGTDGFTEASNTWYYIWAISNGVTAGGLLSASASAPTLPTSYRYKALLGVVFNDGSSNFRNFTQVGKDVAVTGVEAFDQVATDPEVFTLTNFIPPIAARVEGFIAPESGIRLAVRVSNNATLADWRYFMAETYGGTNYNGFRGGTHFDMPIINPPQLTVGCASAPTDVSMFITGYTLR